MRQVLVTGSSGWLGAALVRRLQADGVACVGLDPVPSPTTTALGSVADRALVRHLMRGVDAVVHAGALHKPHVSTHPKEAFLETNVQGTLVLLEEAVASGTVDRFVFTSTTSLMIDRGIRAGREGGADRAAWLTEEHGPLRPRNIYGVSKLAAEHLCRLQHELTDLPIVVLRTARFFPEEDDRAHRIPQSGPNTKANELLFRRLSLADIVESHVLALERAPALAWDLFLISADTPFCRDDCRELLVDAPAVVARYFPRFPEIYERRGFTMFASIDRVYDPRRAKERLGFHPRDTFARLLERLEAGDDLSWLGDQRA
jgi:UDP-glucose 4-epimerase